MSGVRNWVGRSGRSWTKTPCEWASDGRTVACSAEAQALVHMGTVLSNRDGADGRFEGRFVQEIIFNCNFRSDAAARAAVRDAVKAGWWHDRKTATACRSPYCELSIVAYGLPSAKGYMECDFGEHQFLVNELGIPFEQLRKERDNDLKYDRKLRDEIQQRDESRCRYCGIVVSWLDRRSPRAATYDHLDPKCRDGKKAFGNTAGNVVTACNRCNGVKRDRKVVLTPAPQFPFMGVVPPADGRPGLKLWEPGTTPEMIADALAEFDEIDARIRRENPDL